MQLRKEDWTQSPSLVSRTPEHHNTSCSNLSPWPHLWVTQTIPSWFPFPSLSLYPRHQFQHAPPPNPRATPPGATDRLKEDPHLSSLDPIPPESHPQLCSRKSAVVSLSSLTLSPMDHKDLLLETSFPQLIPIIYPSTPAGVTCEHNSCTGQENRQCTAITFSGNLERKEKPRNKWLTQQREIHKWKPLTLIIHIQMLTCQHKNRITNSQGNMSSLETSYPTTAGPDHSNIAKAQEKDLKTDFM